MPPPDYHLASFWNDRFKVEPQFEWLGDGKETIVPHLRAFLRSGRPAFAQGGPPRLLHIGAGTSTLSEGAWEAYTEEFGDKLDDNVLLNLDFSETAVRRGIEAEEAKAQAANSRRRMRWARADVLQWNELAAALDVGDGRSGDGNGNSFGVVLDKSTADAISCADDVPLDATSPGVHPTLARHLSTRAGKGVLVPPVELLALHLAALVHPGGIWIALSFSANRFSFLQLSGSTADASMVDDINAARYWNLRQVDAVEAPSGLDWAGVHAPVVQHYVYVMRRSTIHFE